MKKIAIVGLSLLSSFSFGHTISKLKRADLLFSQTAMSANLIAIKSRPGYYHLVMHNTLPNTTWFTDRPYRRAGTMSTASFVRHWNRGPSSFAKDHPNAELISIIDHHGLMLEKNAILELMTPSYQPKIGQLSYVVKAIKLDNTKSLVDRDLHQTTLFIDKCHWVLGFKVC